MTTFNLSLKEHPFLRDKLDCDCQQKENLLEDGLRTAYKENVKEAIRLLEIAILALETTEED